MLLMPSMPPMRPMRPMPLMPLMPPVPPLPPHALNFNSCSCSCSCPCLLGPPASAGRQQDLRRRTRNREPEPRGSTRSKARVDGLRQTNESAEVLGFLERTQQDFQSITMPGEAGGSDVRYNIRRQVVSKVVNLGKDALLQLVQRAVGSVLDIDEDEENLPDLTAQQSSSVHFVAPSPHGTYSRSLDLRSPK